MNEFIILFSLYLDGKHCEKCQKPCQECWNLTSCLTCQNKYALLGDQCHEKCPDGYYRDDTQCLPCHPLCGTCQGLGENDCKTCAEGYQFDGRQKKCLSLCPNGNFYNKLTQVSISIIRINFLYVFVSL